MTTPIPPYQQASDRVLNFLRRTDTCAVSNAIELFRVRRRDQGFIRDTAVCQFPSLAPIAGYAVTGRIRTSEPPIAGAYDQHLTDWWEYVATLPSPKVIVLQDLDPVPGTGAFFGEIHARISQALNCVAYVTNGTIRDVPALQRAQFQCFASGRSISHSYAGITEFGRPVEIGGLKIAPGDLLQGDCHGVQAIPLSIAEELPETVRCLSDREAELITFCESPGFSLEKLIAMLKQKSSACSPAEPR